MDRITFPVKVVNGTRWVDLASVALSYEVCGETVRQKPDLSFAGGHRVRLYLFKKNVHLKYPERGVELDISEVPTPSMAPRKQSKKKGGR